MRVTILHLYKYITAMFVVFVFKITYSLIYPKAVTVAQLYGHFDPISHDWNDGMYIAQKNYLCVKKTAIKHEEEITKFLFKIFFFNKYQ